MGRLIYSLSVSQDGYAADAAGSLDWVTVDEELHTAFNDETRGVRAMLFGRRMYEVMAAYWPTALDDPDATPAMLDFARLWKAIPKLVVSTTLERVHRDCRLAGGDALAAAAALRAEPGDASVGGPTLAGALLRAGLVDEIRQYVNPVILGGGLPFLPRLEAPLRTRLIETRTFSSGVVLLRHEVAGTR